MEAAAIDSSNMSTSAEPEPPLPTEEDNTALFKSSTTLSAEEAVERLHTTYVRQEISTAEFAKSWKKMLGVFMMLFLGASLFSMQKLFPITNFLAFEVLTMVSCVTSYLFVQRADGAVKYFQAALLLALLQAGWWLYVNVYKPSVLESVPREWDLDVHQFPLGSLFFFVAWAFDRLSVKTSNQVVELRKEVISLEKKSL